MTYCTLAMATSKNTGDNLKVNETSVPDNEFMSYKYLREKQKPALPDVATFLCSDFLRTALFLEKLLLPPFLRVITSTQQLLFRSGCFFRAASFFKIATSSQQSFFQDRYFFRAKLLRSSHFFRIGSSLGQVLFRTPPTFLVEKLFSTKTFSEEVLFRSRYFCEASNFPE